MTLLLVAIVATYLHTISSAIINSNRPSQYVFGRVNLTRLSEANVTYDISGGKVENITTHWVQQGLSVSFYLVSIDPTSSTQKLFSVFGSDVYLTSPASECSVKVVTSYNLNVTYKLGGCENRHILLELYLYDSPRVVSLYDNLVVVYGTPEKGWCEFEGVYLEEEAGTNRADYSYPNETYTLAQAKQFCLNTTIGNTGKETECRGITMFQNKAYTLRTGAFLIKSKTKETTWMTGPCTSEDKIEYKITLKSGDGVEDGTENTISMVLFGTVGNVTEFILTSKLESNTTYNINKNKPNIGNLLCIQLKTNGSGAFSFKKVDIQVNGGITQTFNNTDNTVLSTASSTGVQAEVVICNTEFLFYKTDKVVELAHINVDLLKGVATAGEVTSRFKRYELGSLLPGKYLNFEQLAYNEMFRYSDGPLDYVEKTRVDSGILGIVPISLNEGGFIQERQNELSSDKPNYLKFTHNDKTFTGNFIWVANNSLFVDSVYCKKEYSFASTSAGVAAVYETLETAMSACSPLHDCCAIQEKDEQKYSLITECSETVQSTGSVTVTYIKGYCNDSTSEGEPGEFHQLKEQDLSEDKASLNMTMYGREVILHYFGSLPQGSTNTYFTADAAKCQWVKTSVTFKNDLKVLLLFKTLENGYRIKTWKDADMREAHEELYVQVNSTAESSSYSHLLNVSGDVAVVAIQDMDADHNDCQMFLFQADVCQPKYKENNYGKYFTDRLPYGQESVESCTGNATKKLTWSCDKGQFGLDAKKCPFYQCYNTGGRTLSATYVAHPWTLSASKLQTEVSGDCCDGQWEFLCGGPQYSVNYTNCTALKTCDIQDEVLTFDVEENDGPKSSASITTSKNLTAASKESMQHCNTTSGHVYVKCNGCTGTKFIQSNTCKPQYCIRAGSNTTKEFGTTTHGYFNVTIPGPMKYDSTVFEATCLHGGSVTITCVDGELKAGYDKCNPIPTCASETIEVHPLIGNVTFPNTTSNEQYTGPCSDTTTLSSNNRITRNCSAEGTWGAPDYSNCKKSACKSVTFTRDELTFATGETAPDTWSNTTCEHDMCREGKCGARLCNATSGVYETPDYSLCQFNCTFKGQNISHGVYGNVECERKNGNSGIRYATCSNSNITRTSCLKSTCPYDGGEGCLDSDPDTLKTKDKSEIVSDFASYLTGDSVDLSSETAQTATKNVVNVLVPKKIVASEVSKEMIKEIADVIDKVSVKLAKKGGEILSDQVDMYGIVQASGRKRSAVESKYLDDQGIDGSGFNGSIGLAVYRSTDLFASDNTSVIDSPTVKSVNTELDSSDIDINIKFKKSSYYNASAYTCRYYETDTGEWSTEGCTKTVTDNHVTCHCTHLTSFAVLVSLNDIADSAAQTTANQIFLTISITCLILTLVAITPFKKLRSRQIMQIHLNLIVANLLGCISFLLLDVEMGGNTTLCTVLSFCIHFFWLSVFGWMVAEGVTMYTQTVQALKSYGKKDEHYVLKVAVMVNVGSVLLPALGLVLDNTVDGFSYASIRESGTCFLGIPYSLLCLFLIPLYLTLCASVFFFIRISLVIVAAKKQGTAGKAYWKRQLKAIISIATVTGVAWIIAPFLLIGQGNKTYATIMQWLFSVVLGLQGVVVFIVQVVLSDEVKANWLGVYKGSTMEKWGEGFASSFTTATEVLSKNMVSLRTTKEQNSISISEDLKCENLEEERKCDTHNTQPLIIQNRVSAKVIMVTAEDNATPDIEELKGAPDNEAPLLPARSPKTTHLPPENGVLPPENGALSPDIEDILSPEQARRKSRYSLVDMPILEPVSPGPQEDNLTETDGKSEVSLSLPTIPPHRSSASLYSGASRDLPNPAGPKRESYLETINSIDAEKNSGNGAEQEFSVLDEIERLEALREAGGPTRQ